MSLRLERLSKRYVAPDGSAVPVIDVPLFDLADGEQVALVGGSGTGKTTLLHLIAGILAPDAGRIVIDGVDVASLAEAERDVFRGRRPAFRKDDKSQNEIGRAERAGDPARPGMAKPVIAQPPDGRAEDES